MTSPQQPQPHYASAAPPSAGPSAPATSVPGRGLGIAGFVTAFLVSPVGLVLSIIALVQSRKAGHKNGLALAGVIVSVLVTIGWVVVIIVTVSLAAELLETCRDLGPGTHVVGGATYTCS
ncbi:DUF4190 domain-containing protein [Xylanimonas ulmi]|uniref:DUF4190 domain-containing protein n=1 Tax=Xylanimonas ulmi TaxID=228973 RepID=A0A4Q7M526_9MICO|nr:DUF4190 domain-containing protein [Xylanibacterium ulmi]RZS61109.1 hypothetical protein EV386_1397 [Xylanibacterium ulmi]